jgi:hypothetical protein
VKPRGNLALWEKSRKETRYLFVYKAVQKTKQHDFKDKHKKEGRAMEAEENLMLYT